jgi:hypothetical protein
MEKRTPDGQLDFSEPSAPMSVCSEDEIAKYYFAHSGDTSYSASMETIYGWFKAKNFTVRPKTW